MTQRLSHRSPRMPGLLLLVSVAFALGIEVGAGIALGWGPWAAAGAEALVILAGIGLFLLLTRHQEEYCERGECHQGVCHRGGSAAEEVSDGG